MDRKEIDDEVLSALKETGNNLITGFNPVLKKQPSKLGPNGQVKNVSGNILVSQNPTSKRSTNISNSSRPSFEGVSKVNLEKRDVVPIVSEDREASKPHTALGRKRAVTGGSIALISQVLKDTHEVMKAPVTKIEIFEDVYDENGEEKSVRFIIHPLSRYRR